MTYKKHGFIQDIDGDACVVCGWLETNRIHSASAKTPRPPCTAECYLCGGHQVIGDLHGGLLPCPGSR